MLTNVTKNLKGKSSGYGYKVVKRKHGLNREYGPIYVRQFERWKIGKWYKASDGDCRRYSNQAVKTLFNWLAGKYLRLIHTLRGDYYQPGFHYYDTLTQVVASVKDHNRSGDCILYCEFKNVHTHGSQWGINCRVAGKMMPMEEISFDEARKALAYERNN
jgi:hypothetical protein